MVNFHFSFFLKFCDHNKVLFLHNSCCCGVRCETIKGGVESGSGDIYRETESVMPRSGPHLLVTKWVSLLPGVHILVSLSNLQQICKESNKPRQPSQGAG